MILTHERLEGNFGGISNFGHGESATNEWRAIENKNKTAKSFNVLIMF